MTKECIEIIRQSLIPFVKKELFDIIYEGLGKSDAEEFEKDLNEILDLAIKALEQQSDDCVSRAKVLEMIEQIQDAGGFIGYSTYSEARYQVNNMSPVTPKLSTSDDCVSLAEVFEIMGNLLSIPYDFDRQITEKDVSESMDKIKALSPVTPTQSWTPVSEKLPKEDGEYLLYGKIYGKIDEDEENYIFIGGYDSCGEQFGIWQEQFDRTTLGCLGSEFFDYSSVIAWQPLPKPYEEKQDSEDEEDE